MKKLIFLILLLITSLINISAQENAELLDNIPCFTFKGIELRPDLRFDDFISQLKEKGLKDTELTAEFLKNKGIYILKGTFQNFSDCTIYIFPTKNKTNVSNVAVTLPGRKSFKELKQDYDILKLGLTKKYLLAECTEKFYDKYIEKTTSDILKYNAIKNNEADFQSLFRLNDSEIAVFFGQALLNISVANIDYDKIPYVTLNYLTINSVAEHFTNDDDL